MKLTELSEHFADRPFFETRQVAALFEEPTPQIQARLSRWVAAGKLMRVRRGKYLLPREARRAEVSSYYISNYLLRPSYVSMYSALEYHGLIPEAVAAVEALTPKHGSRWDTPVGTFRYKSIAQDRFFGYRPYSAQPQAPSHSPRRKPTQRSFLMARPEKALLDLFYSRPGEWDEERIRAMRFQNIDENDNDRLLEYARRYASRRVTLAADRFLHLHAAETIRGVA